VADDKLGLERTQLGHVPAGEPPISGVDETQAASSPPISGAEETLASTAPAAPVDEQLTEVSRAHYDIRNELARGGMGRILVAHDRRIGRVVALKELLNTGDAVSRRFEREALVTGRLQHPAIVPVYEAGRWPSGEPFFAMKLVEGTSLDKVIAETTTLGARLALLPTIIQIAEAMAYAHSQHVIHRDLKPQNVLVGAFGETVVVDWGLAKDLADAAESLPSLPSISSPAVSGDLTMAGSVMGTPTYMPVEQARGLPLDERCDVYALGAILYHTLAGKAPYTGKTADEILDKVNVGPPTPIAEVAPGVPEELAAIVDKAMARKLADRYRTAGELAAELGAFQAGQLVAAHRYSRWDLIKRFAKRHRAALSAAAALLVIGGVIAIISVRQVISARDEARTALATVEREKQAFLVEEGRQELVAGKTTKAATLLGEAYRSDADDYTRMLLAHAMRPLDAAIARIDTTPTRDLGALAGDRFLAIDDTDAIAVWSLDGTLLERIDGDGRTVAIAQDGTRFAFQRDTALEVVRASDLTRLAKLEVGELEVAATTLAPDGSRVYAVLGGRGKPTELVAWSVAGGPPQRLVLDVAFDGVASVAVLATGVVYVQTQEDGVRMVTAELTTATRLPGDTVHVSGDGSHVAFGLTRTETGATQTSIGVFTASAPAVAAAAIPNASLEFAIDRRGTRVLQLPGVTDAVLCEVTTVAHDPPRPAAALHEPLARISGVRAALSPDGTRVATTDDNHVIRIWDDRGEVLAVWPGHQREIKALVFSPDGRSLISGGDDGVRTWRVVTPDPLRIAASGISEGAGSPDGKALLVLGVESTALIDTATGRTVREFASGPAWTAAFSPDGTKLVTTASTGTLVVWSIAGKRLVETKLYAWSARFSPDGTKLVTAGDVDGHLLDVGTGADLALDGADLVRSARFSADGTQVITGGHDGIARIYDARTGALLTQLRGHTSYLVDASFDASGTRAITASGDRTARLWDIRTGLVLGTFVHPSVVLAAELSGDRILTVARDGGRVWDARSLRQVAALGGTTDPIVGGMFLRDGSAIATFTTKLALIWETSRGAPLFTLPPRPPPSRTVTIQMEAANGDGGNEVVDPRLHSAALVELVGARVAFARAGRVAVHDLGGEQRPVTAVAELIRTRGDWKIADGGLVPAREAVERKTSASATTLDFTEDLIIGSISKPELELLDETERTGVAGQILAAKQVAAAGKRRDLRVLVAAIPDAPAVSNRLLYVLAWLRHEIGDDLAAFKTLRAASVAPGWKASETKTLARELARFGAAAEASYDDTFAAVRAATKLSPIELLTLLDEVYRETGELALEQRVLAELLPIAPRDQLAALEVRQARHALDGGDPRSLRRLAVSAIDHLSSLDPAGRAAVRKDVVDLASRAIRYHDSARDESYLRAAHKILQAVLPTIPDAERAQVAGWLADAERRIASGVNAIGVIRQDRVREVIRSRLTQLRRCYERALVTDPKLAGALTLSFVIIGQKPSKIEVAASSVSDPKVGSCVKRELEKLTFPRARYAGVLVVNYPLVFQVN